MPVARPRDPEMLNRLLKACRSRLDPAALGDPSEGILGVSQGKVADYLAVSSRHYGMLETGKAAWNADFARRVAEALRMDEQETATLFRAALDSMPPACAIPLHVSMISEGWRAHVRRQTVPSYISDRAWNVIYANDAYYEAFPAFAPGAPCPERNVMMWLLTRLEAEEYLVDWRNAWAPDHLNHVRSMYELHRDHPGLQKLMEALKKSHRLSGMWEGRSPDSADHPDTRVRTINHPKRGRMDIQIVAAFPFSPNLSACTFVSMEPVGV